MHSSRFRERKGAEPSYSAHAVGGTAIMGGGSEEHIVGKAGGIEYEREYTVEESYIESAGVVAQEKHGLS